MPEEIPEPYPYLTSAWFWRRDIREETDIEELRRIALTLVHELETHKQQIRELGAWPKKHAVTASEAAMKGWDMAEEISRVDHPSQCLLPFPEASDFRLLS